MRKRFQGKDGKRHEHKDYGDIENTDGYDRSRPVGRTLYPFSEIKVGELYGKTALLVFYTVRELLPKSFEIIVGPHGFGDVDVF